MNNQYIYKWYSNGEYQGAIKNVINDFKLNKEINTAGSQLEIQIGESFNEIENTLISDYLIDNENVEVVDDELFNIFTEKEYSLGSIPTIGNTIKVYEFNEATPNGQIVFEGRVTNWSTSYKENNILLTALSFGSELANYMAGIQSDEAITEYTSFDASVTLFSMSGGSLSRNNQAAQTFQVPSQVEVNKIILKIANAGTMATPVTLGLYVGNPLSIGTLLAQSSRNISPQSATDMEFILDDTITLNPSTEYIISLQNTNFGLSETQTVSVSYDSSASSYADGAMYIYNDVSGWGAAANDMYFKVILASATNVNVFSQTDPADIVRTAIDDYNARGGRVTYTNTSIEDTGLTVTHTFKFNTYFDIVDKCLEFSPAFTYWYIDPATNILYFKQRSDSVDHTFILGKHIEDLTIGYSLEGIKNAVYFSGGDDGTGQNILVTETSPVSISKYGQWLDQPSDNRVTTETSGELITQAIIGEFSEPKFQISFKIFNNKYDVHSIFIGDMIRFANANSLVNNLFLQVRALEYTSAYTTVYVDDLPKTQVRDVFAMKRDILFKNTEDNPGAL